MATREENLKKINEALENLSDEQLEKIAGGEVQHFPTAWKVKAEVICDNPQPIKDIPITQRSF